MSMVLKLFLSMSCSGALLIVALFLGKGFLKDKLSRQWQYYIWLIVIMRLLLPFRTEINLMGKTYQAMEQRMVQEEILPQSQSPDVMEDSLPAVGQERENEMQEADDGAGALTAVHPFRDMITLLTSHIWLVWLAVVLGMLIRKVTVYQSFVQYVNSGSVPVSDMDSLDRLSLIAEQMGIHRPVELCVNPQISSPLLMGFFHPCIVLSGVDISEKDFRYIMLHELTHYKRRDMFYKWLVQLTVCLHWFNPFVYLMSREITKACEFSCDEAVLAKIGYTNAEDYGKTLLDAMAAVGKYRGSLGAVTLSENIKILKERLNAIMNYKKKSMAIQILTGALTLCIILGASILGVYPVLAAPNQKSEHAEVFSAQTERYYEAGSLPLFQIAFSRLDEKEQLAWLERLYADDAIPFFSIAASVLDGNSSLLVGFAEKAYTDGKTGFFSIAVNALEGNHSFLADFAEKAYTDDETAFFSILADCMDERELESYLERALEDGYRNFQSLLYDKLALNEEKDIQEEKWEEQQIAEYQAVGVTKDGKNYYYQGHLVNIFMDIWSNRAYHTLEINPAGTVNIRLTRGENGKIIDVSYMDEAEVVELLGDRKDPDDF